MEACLGWKCWWTTQWPRTSADWTSGIQSAPFGWTTSGWRRTSLCSSRSPPQSSQIALPRSAYQRHYCWTMLGWHSRWLRESKPVLLSGLGCQGSPGCPVSWGRCWWFWKFYHQALRSNPCRHLPWRISFRRLWSKLNCANPLDPFGLFRDSFGTALPGWIDPLAYS